MKRLVLIGLVLTAVAWILFSSYELWMNKDNTSNPNYVFCDLDQSILVINNIEETKAANFLEAMTQNPLVNALDHLTFDSYQNIKVYISGSRPIIIFEKENNWNNENINEIKSYFKEVGVQFKVFANHLMVFQNYTACETPLNEGFFLTADKKASANLWVHEETQWKRTDIYNLSKGLFEYRSSEPNAIYGAAVKDIDLFSSVIPVSSTSYKFTERFYAQINDSIFKKGPMDQWVDRGFVEIDYAGSPVIISDYRSQQVPSLILIEQSKTEESVKIKGDIHSFMGFQLTHDFPSNKEGRFYSFEIEDKIFFTEDEDIARKIQVDYQLGKTLALSPERKDQFFSGLPSHVNTRTISSESKSSLTWKDHLLFEVNTLPPNEQFAIKVSEKDTWSKTPRHEAYKMVPIIDHLRKGISILSYGKGGKYELIGPNGQALWSGTLDAPIEGEVQVIDLFENDKHQFLFHTKNQVYLIDLNGHKFGSFPYKSDEDLTSGISQFEWGGTKRFLVGNEKGEVIMLKNDGNELNIIQVGKEPIISTPYALNVKGNLRVWTLNNEMQGFLGYLERPAKASLLNKIEQKSSIKYKGNVLSYFEKEGKVYVLEFDSKTERNKEPKMIDEGKLFSINDDQFIISDKNSFKVFNHDLTIIYTKQLPFNEVGDFQYHPEKKVCVVLDYLQNKIHAYDKNGDEVSGFPKEGRNNVVSYYNKDDKTLYTYTILAQSIVCYKTNL